MVSVCDETARGLFHLELLWVGSRNVETARQGHPCWDAQESSLTLNNIYIYLQQ